MKRLLIYLILFLAGLCVTAFVSQFISSAFGTMTRESLLWQSVTQSLLAFVLPAWIIAGFNTDRKGERWSSRGAEFVKIDKAISPMSILGVIMVYLVSLPAMNQIIFWNQEMHLPQSMSSIEDIFRNWENAGAITSEKILSCDTIGGLLSGILVVGVITGISEEIFFRGGLQQLIRRCGCSEETAIWFTAFIFSTLHFQFFGFIPRLLMGAMFGYMLLWTGSLWTSSLAHALNNSMVVLAYWISNRGLLPGYDLENMGVSTTGLPVLAIISAIALTLMLFFRKKFFFHLKQKGHSTNCKQMI